MNAAFVPCLVGPTGSGKSDAGIEAARLTHGEVIACDASTVYRGLPVLTATPQAPSDVPHHLLGILDPYDTYDAARYLADCDHAVARIRGRGHTPWIVGGTALYLRGWLKGFGADVGRDDAFRQELQALVRERGPAALHARLAAVDPERAAELHPNDVRRVGRALEIQRATGRPASAQRLDWRGPDRAPARIAGLARQREDLDARIAARTDAMFEAGVVEEARAFLAGVRSPQASQVLGLEELRLLLEGSLDEAGARERIARRTRRFARKQLTFFRSFDRILWIDVPPAEPPAATARRVLAALGMDPQEATST